METREEKIQRLTTEIAALSAKEQALKILINSCYGALGNPRFLYHRVENAHAITKTGQAVILWVEKRMNAWMHEQTRKNKNYAIYCDTDSVVGNTKIDIDGSKIEISAVYDSIKFPEVEIGTNNFRKDVTSYTTLSCSEDGNIERKPIRYISKHLVKKKFYKITSGDKSITVTQDHSICVKRDGKIIYCRPSEVISGDEIVIND